MIEYTKFKELHENGLLDPVPVAVILLSAGEFEATFLLSEVSLRLIKIRAVDIIAIEDFGPLRPMRGLLQPTLETIKVDGVDASTARQGHFVAQRQHD